MFRIALLVMVMAASAVFQGCGSLVSRREYLDTMMSGTSTPEVMAYTPPVAIEPAAPVGRGGFVLSTNLRLDDRDDLDLDLDDQDDVVSGSSARDALTYRSDVHRRIEALRKEMRLLQTRAELKGAPTRAALEPKLRAFNDAVEALQGRSADTPNSDASRLIEQSELEVDLASAEQAAREANDVVNATRGLGENRSGT